MSATPTPRTNSIAHRGYNESVYIAEMTDLARDLERKLAKSQDGEAILWSQLAERDEWLACANAKLAAVTAERDKLLLELKSWRNDCCCAMKKERDELKSELSKLSS